ncbi:hypothetical protein [Evtepia gabavorous]|uniref:hypothetical protein n=1 Tax=Evtepia gabavorous TaxID=2211183 RepID=UPI003AF1811D
MQDAIMKGNGNSRYLKTVGEALSLYPTYEDFMQAMVAGIFPVDFNGINKDGWTQLGTLLNKANLLSDTVISTLGLSTGVNSTPNDAFNVLANIGNVHVWRKTVVAEEEVPAGYTLGPVEANKVLAQSSSNWGNSYAAFTVASSITVDDGGNVTMNDTSGVEIWQGYFDPNKGEDNLLGKFIQFSHVSADHISSDLETGVYFIPSNATFIRDHSSAPFYTKISACQKVNAYPLTPAGTHVTYLTSVNRNAYQEGDDAKEAGYVLGDMVSGYLFASAWTGNASNYYSETIKVSDTGTLTQENVKSYTANATNDSWVSNIQSAIRGKFITVSGEKDNGGSEGTDLVYIPDDAIVSYFENGVSLGYPYNYGFLVNKMQQVTGYPAIPAGTTIEYLGVLGEKSKIQVLSYVGTGTSGEANPCSVTASFPIKALFFLGYIGEFGMDPSYLGVGNGYWGDGDVGIMFSKCLTTAFTNHIGFDANGKTSFGKKSADGKTFYWYNKTSAVTNDSGSLYYFLALG